MRNWFPHLSKRTCRGQTLMRWHYNKLKPVSAVLTVQAKMNCSNLSLYTNKFEKVRLHDWERFYLLSALSLPEFIKHLTNECAVVVLSATVAFCKHSFAKCNKAFTDFSKKGFQWEITAQSACISAAFLLIYEVIVRLFRRVIISRDKIEHVSHSSALEWNIARASCTQSWAIY